SSPRAPLGRPRAFGNRYSPTLRRGRWILRWFPPTKFPRGFAAQTLYEENFVIAMLAEHPFGKDPTLDAFCHMQHLVVSLTGDVYGFVDDILAEHGRSRRVALTAPNFMFALMTIAESDLIAALARTFVAMYAPRFDIVSAEAPLPLLRSRIRALASRAALMDAGVAWLFDRLAKSLAVKYV
ncbi:LysR substrate-binding domain-containing protein, partial [Sinorhizobium medicae]|uniref:LysR substrate-binding domain-containing protein n=1 Tax=Sinorhizobium medicae TaxID=110321 RepID=UPI0027DE26E5